MTTGRRSDRTIAGLVLAAGLSGRYEGGNKLRATVRGEAVIRRTVRAYLDAGLSRVLVVVGHDAEAIVGDLADLPVRTVFNPDYAAGQSTSLIAGVSALSSDTDAAVIGVGDQPLLSADVVRHLVGVRRAGDALLVVPRYAGQRGNPVLFAHHLFPELLQARGDVGGRHVIRAHAAEVVWVDIDDPHIGADMDVLEDLERIEARFGGHPSI